MVTRKQVTRTRGFTIIEVLVVVVVVAILLTLVLPSYQQQLRSTRRTIGAAALQEVMARQELFFLNNRRFADSLSDLGFQANPHAIDASGNRISLDSEGRVYLIELTSHVSGYKLLAIPQLAQRKDYQCGTLSLTARGVRSVSGKEDAISCW